MYSIYFLSHNFLQCLAIYYMQGPQETPSETSEVLSPADLRAITDVIPATPSVSWLRNQSAIGWNWVDKLSIYGVFWIKKGNSKQRNSEKKLENNYISYTTKDSKSQRQKRLYIWKKSCRMVACLDLSWSSSFSSRGIAFGFRANALRSPHPLPPCYSPTCTAIIPNPTYIYNTQFSPFFPHLEGKNRLLFANSILANTTLR